MIIILKIDEEKEGIVKEKVNTNSKSVFKRARLAGQTGTAVSAVSTVFVFVFVSVFARVTGQTGSTKYEILYMHCIYLLYKDVKIYVIRRLYTQD